MKRVLLLIATNLAVMVVLSIVVSVLGVDRWLLANGIAYGQLLVFSAIFGFGGAFISLLMSKWIAKMSVGAQTIDGDTVELIDPRQLRPGPLDPEIDRYLAAEPFIESDAPEIRNEAEAAVRGAESDRARPAVPLRRAGVVGQRGGGVRELPSVRRHGSPGLGSREPR